MEDATCPTLFSSTELWHQITHNIDAKIPRPVQHVFIDHLLEAVNGALFFPRTRFRVNEC